jgi:hypothetical protein
LTKTVVFGASVVDNGEGSYHLRDTTVNLGGGTIVTGSHPDNDSGLDC